jgi:hypothetical protein
MDSPSQWAIASGCISSSLNPWNLKATDKRMQPTCAAGFLSHLPPLHREIRATMSASYSAFDA